MTWKIGNIGMQKKESENKICAGITIPSSELGAAPHSADKTDIRGFRPAPSPAGFPGSLQT